MLRRVAFLWLRLARRRSGYGRAVPADGDHHMKLQEAFAQCPGKWVAISRRTGAVVAVKATPYELSAFIKEHNLRGVDVLRAPAEDEPEVVGFG